MHQKKKKVFPEGTAKVKRNAIEKVSSWWPLKKATRRDKISVVFISLLVCVPVFSLGLTVRSLWSIEQSFLLFEKIIQFQNKVLPLDKHVAAYSISSAFAPDETANEWYGISLKQLETMRVYTSELESFYERMSHTQHGFRSDTKDSFYSMISYYASYIDSQIQSIFNSMEIRFGSIGADKEEDDPDIANMTSWYDKYKKTPSNKTVSILNCTVYNTSKDYDAAIDYIGEFFDAFIFSQGETHRKYYELYLDSVKSLMNDMQRNGVDATKTALSLALFLQVIFAIVVLMLTWSLRRISYESKRRIKNLDKLVRQQCHELRSKFGPAICFIDHFLESVQRRDVTVDTFKAQAGDMKLALVALREAEKQLQTRLLMYKIMQSNYVSQPETFDLLALMRNRILLERCHSRARDSSLTSSDNDPIDFRIHVSCPLKHKQKGKIPKAIYIRADLYVLNHVMANLLSNARKFCHKGSITLNFIGEDAQGLCQFRITDTGTGVPISLLGDSLFSEKVSYGDQFGDNRSTGLGLPSCKLFCQAAGGTICLGRTQRQDEKGNGGFTEMNFSVAGRLIRIDTQNDISTTAIKENLGSSKKLVQDSNPSQPNLLYEQQSSSSGFIDLRRTSSELNVDIRRSLSFFHRLSSSTSKRSVSVDKRSAPQFLAEQSLIQIAVDDEKTSPHALTKDDGCDAAMTVEDADDLVPSSVIPPPEPPDEIEVIPVSSTTKIIPDTCIVAVVDDSALNRTCLTSRIKKIQKKLGPTNWEYMNFDNIENAMPALTKIHEANQMCIVTLDEQLASTGGVMTGIQGTRWLLKDLGWKGIIISSSGDADVGSQHLALGAHLSWSKPLPSQDRMLTDLKSVFSSMNEKKNIERK